MPKITILIVNYNSSDFIANSLYCLSKLTHHPYQVFILDNNSKIKDFKKLESLKEKYKNLTIIREKTNLTGSIAHGTALNKLVTMVNTPYFSILDADATWLKKDWDKILVNQIDNKIKVIGTQASKNIYEDFPLMYAILFETNSFKKLNIDFRPKGPGRDTGHEIREKYLSANLKGKIIFMKNTRQFKQGPFRNLIGVCEYYDKKNTLFASHFGRGSTLGSAKYYKTWEKNIYRLPYIGKFLIKIKGHSEKKKWITICQKIVNKQI